MNDPSSFTAGIRDLFDSERGVVFLVLITICTVLLVLGIIASDQWLEFAKWTTLTLIASKTITTAIDAYRKPSLVPPSETKP